MRRTAKSIVVVIAACVLTVPAGGSSQNPPASQTASAPPFSPAVRAGSLVYFSGTLPTDGQGKIVAGDIKAQMRQALDNLAALAKANGTSLERAATVTVYLTTAADFAGMNDVFRAYWPKDPPARTTVIAGLVLPGALVEVAMVAVADGSERRVIHPAAWAVGVNAYSPGVLAGDTLFTAGVISRSGRDNSPVPGDMAAQTRTALNNLGEVLKAAGFTFADVVSARVYLTDVAAFQAMNTAYREFFPKDPPSRATVRVGLTAPPYLVEITLVAVRGADRAVVIPAAADGTPGKPNPNLSPAIRVGRRLFVSGMLGNTSETSGDVRAQTRETMNRLGRALTAGGFSWRDVVEGTVFLTDAADFALMNEAYRPMFTPPFPARATVTTGLVSPDGLVEIALTAAKRE